ncbi:MAG: tetratricopeptide repeat protein [Bacteroidales bacterium]
MQYLKFLYIFRLIIILPILTTGKNADTIPNTNAFLHDSTNYINYSIELYQNEDYTKFLEISDLAIEKCEEDGNLDTIALILYNKGITYRILGDHSKALQNFYLSLEHYQTLGDAEKEAFALNHIGSIYRVQGNYPGALELFFEALSILQEISHKKGTASILNNIGIVYFYQKNYEKSLEYYKASLEIEKEFEEGYGISISYLNIGEVYKNLGDFSKALDYYLKSLVLAKKYEDEDKDGDSIGILYNEIGSIYLLLGDYALSQSYLEKAYRIFKRIDSNQRIAECNIYFGQLKIELGDYNLAIVYLNSALKHAESIEALDIIASANEKLSHIYEELGNTPKSYKHYKKYIAARDSLYNEDNTKRMVQAEMLYQFEKQMQESKLEQAKRDIKAQEMMRRQKLLRNLLGLILVMLIVIIIAVYSAYKGKKRANKKLAHQQEQIIESNEELLQQQEEILSQRDEIEQKNKILENSQQIIEAKNERIISSIEYAQTIQQAILPQKEQLNEYLPKHMVVFLPKDIVSGDFYWFSNVDDLLFVAVVDCTGHGVPGAFMSLVGNTLLNKIVNEWQTRDPALILELMHLQVRKVLNQDISESKAHAGMDMCLVLIDTSRKKATFAGASRPLYVVNNNEVKRIKGDPRSIGGIQLETQRYFTNREIDLSIPTTLYLTTDGFMDQMNPQHKKFGPRNFSKTLLDIQKIPINQRDTILLKILENHQQEHEQIDDICILGMEV